MRTEDRGVFSSFPQGARCGSPYNRLTVPEYAWRCHPKAGGFPKINRQDGEHITFPAKYIPDRLRTAGVSAALKWGRLLLPFVLAVLFALGQKDAMSRFGEGMGCIGSFLLAGIPYSDITAQMPFFDTAASLFLNLGVAPWTLFLVLQFGVYALVFAAGCLLGGYRGGVLALACSGFSGIAISAHDEQLLYSFFLLVVLCLLILRRRENTLTNNLLCGLGIGISLTVRSVLFVFPVFVVLFDRLAQKGGRAFLYRSLAFFAACYLLLIPWVHLNYLVSGKIEYPERRRGDNNLITTAMGSVPTIGAAAGLHAGIDGNTNTFGVFVRSVAKDPFFYALTVAKRLWLIFSFHPLLLSLFAAAILFNRKRGRAGIFVLPVFFILIHSLFSVEERYLQPLIYLLPPLIAGTVFPDPGETTAPAYSYAGKAPLAAFYLSFAAVLLGFEALTIAYPWRAAKNRITADTFMRASMRFPEDRRFYKYKCRELWRDGDDSGFHSCLGEYSKKFGDQVTGYFLTVKNCASASCINPPSYAQGDLAELYVIKMLKELELGDGAAAGISFNKSLMFFSGQRSSLQRNMELRDEELGKLADLLKKDLTFFSDVYIVQKLVLWPPEGIIQILPGLGKLIRPSGLLKQFNDALYGTRLRGKDKEKLLRNQIAPMLFDLPPRSY